MYLKWLILAILDFLFTLQCYITNPIVCLFADEYGNLPYFLRYWQTWDNTLDVQWMITERKVPSVFRYDYARHYKYVYENHDKSIAGHVLIVDDSFTILERIQRYFCRLAWLYRNTGYGFSYEVCGVTVDGADINKIQYYEKSDAERYILYDTDNAFVFRYDHRWCSKFRWRIFIGWKMHDLNALQTRRCMIANCINPFRG